MAVTQYKVTLPQPSPPYMIDGTNLSVEIQGGALLVSDGPDVVFVRPDGAWHDVKAPNGQEAQAAGLFARVFK